MALTKAQRATINRLRGWGYRIMSQTGYDHGCYGLTIIRRGGPEMHFVLKPDGIYDIVRGDDTREGK